MVKPDNVSGILHRGGHLRSLDPSQIHLGLLPEGIGQISEKGLVFNHLRYSNETAKNELDWFSKARQRIRPNPSASNPYHALIRYDPTNVEQIHVYVPEKKQYLPFRLIGEYAFAFKDFSFEEVSLEYSRKAELLKKQGEKGSAANSGFCLDTKQNHR